MPRLKKESKVLNIKLEKSISDKLERFCEETGLAKTVAVERFLDKCLDEYFKKEKRKRTLN